ncbi:MAG: polysaccharide deacetylase family protein [Acidimicrobiales bacterium]
MSREGTLALLLLAGLVGAACDRAPGSGSGRGAPSSTAVVASSGPTVTVETLRRRGRTARFYYEVKMPQLEGLVDPAAQDRFNDDMRAAVVRVIDDFDNAAAGAPGGPAAGPSTLQGAEETTLLDGRRVSIRLSFSQYLSGAAHPTGYVVVFNEDLASGRSLALADLFRSDAAWPEVLSIGARAQLAHRDGSPDAVPAELTEAKPENFAGFSLTPTGLEVILPTDAPTPPRVRYSWDALAPLVAVPGPLDGLTRGSGATVGSR